MVETVENPKVILTISLDTVTNGISVTGPIHDMVLSLGMLEYAKFAIQAETKKSNIVPSNGTHHIMDFIRRGRKKVA